MHLIQFILHSLFQFNAELTSIYFYVLSCFFIVVIFEMFFWSINAANSKFYSRPSWIISKVHQEIRMFVQQTWWKIWIEYLILNTLCNTIKGRGFYLKNIFLTHALWCVWPKFVHAQVVTRLNRLFSPKMPGKAV